MIGREEGFACVKHRRGPCTIIYTWAFDAIELALHVMIPNIHTKTSPWPAPPSSSSVTTFCHYEGTAQYLESASFKSKGCIFASDISSNYWLKKSIYTPSQCPVNSILHALTSPSLPLAPHCIFSQQYNPTKQQNMCNEDKRNKNGNSWFGQADPQASTLLTSKTPRCVSPNSFTIS